MRSRAIFGAMILAAVGCALAFRLPRLNQRPMHGDEAVQAIKSGILAETGVYRYDLQEHHGPSLYYLSLPAIRLLSGNKFAETNEFTFRIVPVVFGVGLILLLPLLADGLGRPAAACAAFLTAISPAMVFYSRYYIQEMLLVFFTLAAVACGWRYARSRRIGWALLAGASLGMMHATKETCIIAYGAMLLAAILTLVWNRYIVGEVVEIRHTLNAWHLTAAILTACGVSALLFSSFLRNPSGMLDSVRAYASYFARAGGDGVHRHPWYYYLNMLLYTRYGSGPRWSEGLIIALSLAGFAAALRRRRIGQSRRWRDSLIRFIAFYTLIMAVAYSIIPYKTPWCMLGFLDGMILLAGVGAVTIVRALPGVPAKAVVCLVLGAASCNLAWQAYLGSFRFYADNRNPYVYAHPVTDVLHLVERVEDIAQIHPEGCDMVVKVIAPDSDYWPLPWYLRRFRHVGYWDKPPDEPDAPLIIASPSCQEILDRKLLDPYHVSYFGLRPRVFLLLYVKADLWEAFLKQHTGSENP